MPSARSNSPCRLWTYTSFRFRPERAEQTSEQLDDGAKRRLRLGISVFSAYFLVPAFFVGALWLSRPAGPVISWMAFAIAHLVICRLVYMGNWCWVGAPFRWIFPAALAGAAFHSGGGRGFLFSATAFFVLAGLPMARLRATAPRAGATRLSLPFSEGRYYVGQGGQTRLLNHHQGIASQKFAIDFLRLNAAGTRCRGLYPPVLERYAIYGAIVTSPCDGAVTHVVDNIPDLIPPETDRRDPAGNHILIELRDSPGTYVLLAHLQQGSAVVKTGEKVRAGQPAGKIGNSGNTSEPHLHIQIKKGGRPDAWSDGEGAPMLMDGRFLVRGDVARAARRRKSGDAG